jgi:hypothetical protein
MAYSKARHKFKPEALVELNQKAVVDVMYEDDYKTFKGFRVIGNDGSKVRLPEDDKNVVKKFGTRPYRNGQPGVSGKHCMALASVFYDLLNHVSLNAKLLPVAIHEVSAACAQLKELKLTDTDLVVQDRGYHSYRMFSAIVQARANFVVRCKSKSGMQVVDDMLAGHSSDDRITTITMPEHLKDKLEYQGLAPSIKVRFVRIKLSNGSYEVLATSVLNRKKLSIDNLSEIYHMRWGSETFYGILKTRLGLENFSGYSEDAILQDFHATILLSGLETILTMDAEEHLSKQTAGYPKKVNKAVSFNAIKERAFELFMSDTIPADEASEELTRLFLTSPTLVRKDRNPPRKVHPNNKVLDWYKRRRKITA